MTVTTTKPAVAGRWVHEREALGERGAVAAEFRVAVRFFSCCRSGQPRSAYPADLEASSLARGEAEQSTSSLSLRAPRALDQFEVDIGAVLLHHHARAPRTGAPGRAVPLAATAPAPFQGLGWAGPSRSLTSLEFHKPLGLGYRGGINAAGSCEGGITSP